MQNKTYPDEHHQIGMFYQSSRPSKKSAETPKYLQSNTNFSIVGLITPLSHLRTVVPSTPISLPSFIVEIFLSVLSSFNLSPNSFITPRTNLVYAKTQ